MTRSMTSTVECGLCGRDVTYDGQDGSIVLWIDEDGCRTCEGMGLGEDAPAHQPEGMGRECEGCNAEPGEPCRWGCSTYWSESF